MGAFMKLSTMPNSVVLHSTGTNYTTLHKWTIPAVAVLDEISRMNLHLLSLYKFYIEFAPLNRQEDNILYNISDFLQYPQYSSISTYFLDYM